MPQRPQCREEAGDHHDRAEQDHAAVREMSGASTSPTIRSPSRATSVGTSAGIAATSSA